MQKYLLQLFYIFLKFKTNLWSTVRTDTVAISQCLSFTVCKVTILLLFLEILLVKLLFQIEMIPTSSKN